MLLTFALVGAASAHVYTISIPSTFKVTSNSKLPITFITEDGPITYEDFSVVIGLDTNAFSAPNLGEEILGNYDLVKLGYSSTINNFTIKVPLTKNQVSVFPSGQFVVATVITSGIGARYGAQLRFFNQTTQLQY